MLRQVSLFVAGILAGAYNAASTTRQGVKAGRGAKKLVEANISPNWKGLYAILAGDAYSSGGMPDGSSFGAVSFSCPDLPSGICSVRIATTYYSGTLQPFC